MNWKKRAREAIGKSSALQIGATVDEVVSESVTVAADLAFSLESAGAPKLPPLLLSREGLVIAEAAFRLLLRNCGFADDAARNQVERLLAIFLGRVLMEEQGGEWSFYKGRYHTLNPVVIKLPSGKHIDVFGLCQGLHLANRVSGARTGDALARFADSTDMIGFP